MKNLCNDLIYLIFQDLELKDIISLSQTCKYFMRFYKYNEDYIFEKLILKKGLNKYILDFMILNKALFAFILGLLTFNINALKFI